MADNDTLSMELWWRYQYLRDNGHLTYAKKADKCDKFFQGLQWEESDIRILNEQRRPALTINKILSTISNVAGDQILNRTEISFRPRRGEANEETAAALTKIFKQISDNNQLPWVRSDVYTDGLIGSRGFYDVRLDFSDSLTGDARVKQLNPKNVLIDSDADSYDPDDWGDVITSKWLSLQEIELIYGNRWRKALEAQATVMAPYDYDQSDWERDQFGDHTHEYSMGFMDESTKPLLRVVRVLERQWKKLDKREHFVHLPTGEIRAVPQGWEHNEISFYLEKNTDYSIVERVVPRIRWTVGAGREIMHDDWSPYKHFTVVPFFPYFRRGKTVGVVENLLSPQEMLNKISSQELHVVNTTANSGWKIKQGALVNMSIAELESKGSQTGVVLELQDDVNDAEKIQPNQVPSGLERLSYKSEEHIKSISGVPDYVTGFAREDVSNKALRANQLQASSNFAVVRDNMNRTDHILARALLDIVQMYYTEERLIHITTDPLQTKTEPFSVNQVTPEGAIKNDLTLGEYDIVITTQPERDTLEDSTFEQASALRKDLGVNIPDEVLIKASRIPDKTEVIEAIAAAENSEEAQAQREMDRQAQMAEIQKVQADAVRDRTDAQVKLMKARIEAIQGQHPIPPETQLRVEADLAAKKYEVDTNAQLKREEMEIKREELKIQREKIKADKQKVAKSRKKPDNKS